MARILAIDYGGKRSGIAVTDPLQIIASGLKTVDTRELLSFLKDYCRQENVKRILIGYPTNWDNSATHATPLVEAFIKILEKNFPHLPVQKVDERYTSKMAKDSLLESGLKKKDRRNKALVDEVAATIMLQEYLGHNS